MNKKRLYRICGVLNALLCVPFVLCAAPQITIPWQCSFEETEDVSDWVLNPSTSAANDQWVIGTATRSDAQRSLYISSDNGEHTMVGNGANIVMAYRKIHFPEHTAGNKEYDISFDWKAVGNGVLYVFFDYYSTLITGRNNIIQYASAKASTGIPKALLNNAQYVYSVSSSRRQQMSDEQKWKNVSIDCGAGTSYSVRLTAKAAKQDFAIVFVWVKQSVGADYDGSLMGACIDNIQIASATYTKPMDLSAVVQCEDSAFLLSWTCNVNDYSVEYRRSTQSSWRRFTHQGVPPAFQFRIPRLSEGTYDFRVRGWKGSDTTAYTVLNNKSLLCMANRCINYVDLDNAECTYGQYRSSTIDPYQYKGRIDDGADEITSFHTVCTDVNEYDIRTNSKLKVVPDNEYASVRLGTWLCPSSNKFVVDDSVSVNIGGYSVTYDMIVDTATQALLLLKYAIVMEQAHDGPERAFFRLEVLDENDVVLDADCGAKEFYCPADSAEAVESGWNIYNSKSFPSKSKDLGLNGNNIYWKDWTAMGINLVQQGVQQGDHIKVRITARGCTVGGHYCYGYFTLNCASATIETNQCSGNPKITAEAPDGFSYTWFAEKDRALYEQGIGLDANGERVIKSLDADLSVMAGDTNVYVCRLADLLEPSCYFELKTKLSPRTPYPMFQSRHIASNCHNYVHIMDSARVADYGADGNLTITSEACEFSDFSVRSLVTGNRYSNSNQSFDYEANQTGDTLEITQTSYIADGSCSKTIVDTISVPSIVSPDSLVYVTSCRNVGYDFYDDHLIESGVYRHEMSNRYGCDSVEILSLTINPVSSSSLFDTISSLQLPYVLSGQYKGTAMKYQRGREDSYATTQQYTLKFTNVYDCDSTVNLSLTVIPQLNAEVADLSPYCADAGSMSIEYLLRHGDFDSLRISFSEIGHQQKLRDTTIYHNPYAPIVEQNGEISISYPSSVSPNRYPITVEFFQHPSCGNSIKNLTWDVRYASSILQQLYDDAILIRNADNNGGYTFTDYQWYKNGQPIAGAIKPYLYETLDLGSEYCVLLTRTTDGVQQFTCAIVPVDDTGIDKVVDVATIPSLLHIGQDISICFAADVQVTVYSASGNLCYSTMAKQGNNTIPLPHTPGCYVLRVTSENTLPITKTIIVVP